MTNMNRLKENNRQMSTGNGLSPAIWHILHADRNVIHNLVMATSVSVRVINKTHCALAAKAAMTTVTKQWTKSKPTAGQEMYFLN